VGSRMPAEVEEPANRAPYSRPRQAAAGKLGKKERKDSAHHLQLKPSRWTRCAAVQESTARKLSIL